MIEINGVAVEVNQRASAWGRYAAHDPAAFEALAAAPERPRLDSGADVLAHRAAFLTDYQDAAYAERYRAAVERVRDVEAAVVPGREGLALAVARWLFKLMAIKDEYEVARLYSVTRSSRSWRPSSRTGTGSRRILPHRCWRAVTRGRGSRRSGDSGPGCVGDGFFNAAQGVARDAVGRLREERGAAAGAAVARRLRGAAGRGGRAVDGREPRGGGGTHEPARAHSRLRACDGAACTRGQGA